MLTTISLPSGPLTLYQAAPHPRAPTLVVLHTAFGFTADMKLFCDRLAAQGYNAVAPDLFRGRRAASWTEAEHLSREYPSTTHLPTVRDLLEWLQPKTTGGVGLLGFSLGGALALRAVSGGMADVAVSYSGTPYPDHVSIYGVVVLGHFAEHDPYEPLNHVKSTFAGMDPKGELHIYPGVGHCFTEPLNPNYHEPSSTLAWSRTLAFLSQQLRTEQK